MFFVSSIFISYALQNSFRSDEFYAIISSVIVFTFAFVHGSVVLRSFYYFSEVFLNPSFVCNGFVFLLEFVTIYVFIKTSQGIWNGLLLR